MTENERCFLKLHFSVTLMGSVADFVTKIHFRHGKTNHADAPNEDSQSGFMLDSGTPVSGHIFNSETSCLVTFTGSHAI